MLTLQKIKKYKGISCDFIAKQHTLLLLQIHLLLLEVTSKKSN